MTGDGSNEIVFGFADGTIEARCFRTGELLFEDAFDAPLAAVVVARARLRGSGDLLACAADGEAEMSVWWYQTLVSDIPNFLTTAG